MFEFKGVEFPQINTVGDDCLYCTSPFFVTSRTVFEQVTDEYLYEILGEKASLENIQNWLEYEKNGEFLYEILPDIEAAS